MTPAQPSHRFQTELLANFLNRRCPPCVFISVCKAKSGFPSTSSGQALTGVRRFGMRGLGQSRYTPLLRIARGGAVQAFLGYFFVLYVQRARHRRVSDPRHSRSIPLVGIFSESPVGGRGEKRCLL